MSPTRHSGATQQPRSSATQLPREEPNVDAESPELQDIEDVENNLNGPSQNANDGDGDDSSESENRFMYSVDQIVAIFTEFYQFLARLHYDPANLKFPPPEGWPQLAPDHVGSWKEDLALDVIRHLPYFSWGSPATQLDYKSHLVDYSTCGPEFFAEPDWWEEYMDYNDSCNPRMCFIIAKGHESYGQQWVVDAEHGQIYVESLRCDRSGPYDLRVFLRGVMEKYRNLELISSPGRVTLDGSRVPERHGRVSEEEIMAEKAPFGETDVSVQFVRQVYRDYGWPNSFQREECQKYINDLMTRLEEAGLESWERDWKS
ncbi:hypothetical protein QBC47DRAFT_371084 [Echria macrotheca]|uniref:Uncharacterized protein n=1 Tax=Echria macrotheca TaxID=438768 RepID=A0AAJ0F8I0_9PEZI|nr:hypothetical protein QBC47DRAFT_371084 [Echria macrotheca]